jgi:hypothetical protein
VASLGRRQDDPAVGQLTRARIQRRDLARRTLARVPVGRVGPVRDLPSPVSGGQPGTVAGIDGGWNASPVESGRSRAPVPFHGSITGRESRFGRDTVDRPAAAGPRQCALSTVRHDGPDIRHFDRWKAIPLQDPPPPIPIPIHSRTCCITRSCSTGPRSCGASARSTPPEAPTS